MKAYKAYTTYKIIHAQTRPGLTEKKIVEKKPVKKFHWRYVYMELFDQAFNCNRASKQTKNIPREYVSTKHVLVTNPSSKQQISTIYNPWATLNYST